MEFLLVVVRGFAAHAPGDVIDTPDLVRETLGGPHAANVVRVARPDAQPPTPQPTQEK